MKWIARPAVLLGAIVLLAFSIRAGIFFHGIRGSDAYAYAVYAHDITRGEYRVGEIGGAFYGYRYGLLLPLAAAYAFFGVSDYSSAVVPMALSLGTIVLTYAIGTQLVDRRLGLLGALVMATYSASIVGASLVGPDSFLPFYLGFGVWLLFLEVGASGRPRRFLLDALAGVLLGLAAVTRQTSILLLPLFLAVAAHRGSRLHRTSALVAGVGFVVLSVAGYYTWATGDPLFELRQTIPTVKEYDRLNPVSIWFYTHALFGLDRHGLAWYGLVPFLAVVGAVRAWPYNRGPVIWLLLWVVPILVVFEFGNKTPLPLHKNFNYLSVVAVPLVLLAALAFHREAINTVRWRRAIAWTLLVALLLMGPYGAWRLRQVRENDSAPYIAAAEVLRNLPADTLYLPRVRWPYFLAYHLGYRAGTADAVALDAVRSPDAISHGYVVVHDRYLKLDEAGLPLPPDKHVPAFFLDPPAHWRVLVRFQGHPAYNRMVLYRVGPPVAIR